MKKTLSIIAIGLVSLFSADSARGEGMGPAHSDHPVAAVRSSVGTTTAAPAHGK